MLKKRINAETLEGIVLFLMVLIGVAIIIIFMKALNLSEPDPLIIIVELLLLLITSVLGLIYVMARVWEQHISPDYLHKRTHELHVKRRRK